MRDHMTGNFVLRNVHVFFQAMASTEEKAYEIMRELDVSYVLVIFGGLTGYSSDGNVLDSTSGCRAQILRKLDDAPIFLSFSY